MKKMMKVSGAPATALLLLVSTPYLHGFTATEPDSKILGAAAPTIDQADTETTDDKTTNDKTSPLDTETTDGKTNVRTVFKWDNKTLLALQPSHGVANKTGILDTYNATLHAAIYRSTNAWFRNAHGDPKLTAIFARHGPRVREWESVALSAVNRHLKYGKPDHDVCLRHGAHQHEFLCSLHDERRRRRQSVKSSAGDALEQTNGLDDSISALGAPIVAAAAAPFAINKYTCPLPVPHDCATKCLFDVEKLKDKQLTKAALNEARCTNVPLSECITVDLDFDDEDRGCTLPTTPTDPGCDMTGASEEEYNLINDFSDVNGLGSDGEVNVPVKHSSFPPIFANIIRIFPNTYQGPAHKRTPTGGLALMIAIMEKFAPDSEMYKAVAVHHWPAWNTEGSYIFTQCFMALRKLNFGTVDPLTTCSIDHYNDMTSDDKAIFQVENIKDFMTAQQRLNDCFVAAYDAFPDNHAVNPDLIDMIRNEEMDFTKLFVKAGGDVLRKRLFGECSAGIAAKMRLSNGAGTKVTGYKIAASWVVNVAMCYDDLLKDQDPDPNGVLTCQSMSFYNDGGESSSFHGFPGKSNPTSITSNPWKREYKRFDYDTTRMFYTKRKQGSAMDRIYAQTDKQDHCWYLDLTTSHVDKTLTVDSSVKASDSKYKRANIGGQLVGNNLVTQCAVGASNDQELKAVSDRNEYSLYVADIVYVYLSYGLQLASWALNAAGDSLQMTLPIVGAMGAGAAEMAANAVDLVLIVAEHIYNMVTIDFDNIQFALSELQTHPTDLAMYAQERADANSKAMVECATHSTIATVSAHQVLFVNAASNGVPTSVCVADHQTSVEQSGRTFPIAITCCDQGRCVDKSRRDGNNNNWCYAGILDTGANRLKSFSTFAVDVLGGEFPNGVTYGQAETMCQKWGMASCPGSTACSGKGCAYDATYTWTEEPCDLA